MGKVSDASETVISTLSWASAALIAVTAVSILALAIGLMNLAAH